MSIYLFISLTALSLIPVVVLWPTGGTLPTPSEALAAARENFKCPRARRGLRVAEVILFLHLLARIYVVPVY